MTKTKKSLIFSVLSLVLSVAMLVGTTYAWFTDTVTSGNNVIQAGNLDIDLQYSADGNTWATVEGATDLFNDVTFWEPGATDVVYLKLQNKGSLALKYYFTITADGGTYTNVLGNTVNLKDALVFGQVAGETLTTYANRADAVTAAGSVQGLNNYTQFANMTAGQTSYITLVVTMPTTVDNNYNPADGQVAKINLSLSLIATQLSSEDDSFDNKYDLGTAWMGGTAEIPAENITADEVTIESAEQLAYFAQSVNNGETTYLNKTVKLANDIDLNNIAWTPIAAESSNTTFDGQGHTIKNLKISGTSDLGFFSSAVGMHVKDLKFDNVNITATAGRLGTVVGNGICFYIDNVDVSNVTITTDVNAVDANNEYNGDKIGAVVGYLTAQGNASCTNCTVTNAKLTGYRDMGAVVGYAQGTDCIVTGNTVDGATILNDRTNNYKNYATDAAYDVNEVIGQIDGVAEANIAGNTFEDVTINVIAPIVVEADATAEQVKTAVTNAIYGATAGDTFILPTTDEEINLSSTNITTDDLTIKGDGETVVKVSTPGSQPSVNLPDDNEIVFENVAFDFGNQNYNGIGIGSTKVTYKNCTIYGLLTTYSNCTFIDCTFANDDGKYLVNVYGGTATFTGCTFNGSNRAVYVYTDGGDATATFTDCVFNFSSETVKKSCVMLNAPANVGGTYTVTITNCTDNGGFVGTDGPNEVYFGIYGLKHSPSTVKGTVTVDGIVKYSA